MAFEKYTVNQFRQAYFNKDYSVISEKEFKIVYSEYVDTSGLFYSDDFEKQGLIYNLNARLTYVEMFIRLQRDFIKMFGMPFVKDFKNIKIKYGYHLKWKNDLRDFEEQLKRIEMREKATDSFLEGKIKELNDAREANGEKEKTPEEGDDELKKARMSFIRMLNSLGKLNYQIDGDKTTVEELSLMIKQQIDEQDELKSRNNKHGG